MRAADRIEAIAMTGVSPGAALRLSVSRAREVWAGTADGLPVCIFGVGPASMLDGTGVPWLVATPEIERHAVAFLRRNGATVRRWREAGPLANHADARNEASLRWLEWLGFEIDPPAPFGPFRLPFRRFSAGRA